MVSTTQLYPWVPSLRGRTVIRTILPYDDTSTSVETTPEREVREGVSVDGGGFTLGAASADRDTLRVVSEMGRRRRRRLAPSGMLTSWGSW